MEGVTAKLVVNKHRELVGLITEERLYERCILVAQTAQGVARHELTVADMMRPRAVIPALDYETLKYATVSDLVNTLREAGEEYCLVLDRAQHHIRGLIAVADIAERLHQPVVVKPKSSIARTIEL